MSKKNTEPQNLPAIQPPEVDIAPVLALFDPHRDKINALIEQYQGATINGPDDADGAERVKEGADALRTARLNMEDDRKALTAPFLEAQRELKRVPDEILELSKPVEADLKRKYKAWKDHAEELERQRIQAELEKFQDRIRQMYEAGAKYASEVFEIGRVIIPEIDIRDASDDDFQKFLQQVTDEKQRLEAVEAERKAREEAAQAEARAMREKMEAMKEAARAEKIEKLEAWKAEKLATGKYSHVDYQIKWSDEKNKWLAKPILVEKEPETMNNQPEPGPEKPKVSQPVTAQQSQPVTAPESAPAVTYTISPPLQGASREDIIRDPAGFEGWKLGIKDARMAIQDLKKQLEESGKSSFSNSIKTLEQARARLLDIANDGVAIHKNQ